MSSRQTPRDLESVRLQQDEKPLSAWQRYCPQDAWRDATLGRMESYLESEPARQAFDAHEVSEAYPQEVLSQLLELGLPELLAPRGGTDRFTAYHMCGLNAMSARRDTSVAVTLSVNFLGLIPAYLAANPSQIEQISECIEGGAFSSLLLSELEHGSNLLRNQARAERGVLDGQGAFTPVADDAECTHYRLNGEKHLINGGEQHGLFFVCLRSRNAGVDGPESEVANPMLARGDFTLFWLERGPGMTPVERYYTLPARAADISGVKFDNCVVSADRVLGREDAGLTIVHKTLMLSRGGVAALASGCHTRALDMATTYAASRNVYGKPILALGAICEHLMRMTALDMAVAAMSLKAASLINSVGLAAAHYTCVAKVMASKLAEEGVKEGQSVLGARSLLRELPYERVIRDIHLFGIFDGTSHVMLEELSTRLGQVARPARAGATPVDTIAETRGFYTTPAQPVVEVLRSFRRPLVLPLVEHLSALDELAEGPSLQPLADAARSLFALVNRLGEADAWKTDQGVRLQAAEIYATLEVLVALVELCDGPRRAALGLSAAEGQSAELDAPFYEFGLAFLGGRVLHGLQQFWLGSGLPSDQVEPAVASLVGAHRALFANHSQVRERCGAALQERARV